MDDKNIKKQEKIKEEISNLEDEQIIDMYNKVNEFIKNIKSKKLNISND